MLAKAALDNKSKQSFSEIKKNSLRNPAIDRVTKQWDSTDSIIILT